MTYPADYHKLRFNITQEGVEVLSEIRHSASRHKGFLSYLHPNTNDEPCPVNVWTGQSIGGITTNLRAGRKANVMEILEHESRRYPAPFRVGRRSARLIGISTLYCDTLEIDQPNGNLICSRLNDEVWGFEIWFKVGKKIPTLFLKTSPYLLPLS